MWVNARAELKLRTPETCGQQIVYEVVKFKLYHILFIGFIDYLGIALVYPIFSSMLFDLIYPIIPFDSSSAYRGAFLGILISLTPLTQFFSAPLLVVTSDFY